MDEINKSKHYNTAFPIEAINICRYLGFSLGNAFKYIYRCYDKENFEKDLDKAVYYIKDCRNHFRLSNEKDRESIVPDVRNNRYFREFLDMNTKYIYDRTDQYLALTAVINIAKHIKNSSIYVDDIIEEYFNIALELIEKLRKNESN